MGKGRMKQAMQLAGSQHFYQYFIVCLLSLAWILANFTFLSSTYIFMDPVFQCAKKPNFKFHEIQACSKMNQCQISIFCVIFLVDKFSLTTSLNLICDFQWARVVIQSISPIGSFIGLIVINLLSDTKGRRLAFLITIAISVFGCILNLHGGYSGDIFSLVIAQFLMGFGSYPIVPLGYTLLADFFSDKFRPIAVIIVNSAGGFSAFALGFLYLFGVNWDSYMMIILLVPYIILGSIAYFYLQQSPYILMNLNQQEKALQVLERISIFNGRKQNFLDIRRIVEAQSVRDQESQASLQNVYKKVKEWKYLKSIILITFIYGIGNLNFYGISYSFQEEGFGFGYNSIIAGFVQMVSFVFLNYTVRHFKRRVGMACFYTAVMLIAFTFLLNSVKRDLMLSTVLLGVSRVCSTNAYCLMACMQTQAFTVSIQSTAAGLIQAFALYGAILAPVIVDFANKLGIDSIAAIGFFINFAIWPNYFLRETFQKSNPQTRGPLFQHLKDYDGQQLSDLTSVTSESSS